MRGIGAPCFLNRARLLMFLNFLAKKRKIQFQKQKSQEHHRFYQFLFV